MSKRLTVAEVMTASPATISSTDHLSRAKSLMEELQVNHLPVMENGVVESIISDREIKRFTLPAHKIGADEDLLISDIACPRALVAAAEDPLERVLRQMTDHHISAVVVLDQGELAGIFTEADACKVLANMLEASESGAD